MTNQIRIQSDGTGPFTTVTNADGHEIQGITDILITMKPSDVVRADISIMQVKLDIHAETGYVDFTCPGCGFNFRHVCND